jgi:hypothetical protein
MARTVSAELPHFATAATPADQMKLRLLSGAPTPREALERARSEAIAEARAAFDRARAEDRVAFDRELVERENEFNANTAAALLARLDLALAGIEQRLADATARVLARFLSAKVRERALKELTETIAGLTAGREGMAVKVSGPPLLIAALEPLIADKATAFAVTVAPGAPEVTAKLDDTMIETRLGEWMARLSATMEGAAGE